MTPAERKFLLLVATGMAVMIALLAIDAWFIPVHVLTTYAGRPPLHPLYAFWIPAVSPRICWPLAAATGYAVWVWRSNRFRPATFLGSSLRLGVQCGWLVILAVAVAMIRLPIDDLGASMHVYSGEEFWDDVEQVQSPGWFLAHFTEYQRHKRLSLHGMAHPPGHTLFLWVVTQVFGRSTQAAALSILAVGCSGVIPVFLLARRIFGGAVASRVLMLFPAVPSITMYAISATDFLFLAWAAWSMWLAIETVLGRNPAVAVCAGLVAGLAATFSFAEGFVGIMVALFALPLWIAGTGPSVPRQVGWMAFGLVAWYVLLWFGFGYDWVESFAITNRFHRRVIQAEIGHYTAGMWLYTSLGNLFAFAWYLGGPLMAGSVLWLPAVLCGGIWTSAIDRQFLRAYWLTLALMVFGALFLLEVERIWLFMVGPLLAGACRAMPEFSSPEAEGRWMGWMAGILCLQSIVVESLLFTIW